MKWKWLVAGALILAELALCGAIVGVSWGTLGVMRSGDFRIRVFDRDNVSAVADEEHRAPVSGPATLVMDNRAGDIALTTGGDGEIVVNAHKTAWGPNQAEAEADLAALKVTVTQSGNTVTVTVEQPEEVTVVGSQRPDTVNFVVAVPADTRVTAHTGFGSLSLSGVERGADLHTDSGAIQAADVSGDLDFESNFGDITLDRAQAGRVQIVSHTGKIDLSGVEASGAVNLSSGFGDLNFQAGSAISLEVKTDNGAIVLNDLAVDGPAVARSSFGDVTLTGVAAGSYDLHSDNGKITVDGAAGLLQVVSGFGDIHITGAEAVTLDLETDNGRVDFSGSLGGGPHTVRTGFGDITLTLPADSALDVDLKTGFGGITTDFPLTIAGSADQSHMRGAVNGGGAGLTVKTDNGNITLSGLGS